MKNGIERSWLDRFISFSSHPRQSLEYRARRFALPHLARWHRYRLSKYVDLDFLAKRPKHGYESDFSDFWFLYQAVRRKKPRVILEFGSGGSTVVLAKALHDNNLERPGEQGYLHSIDDQRYWADVTRSILPPFLKEVCEVHHIPTVEIEYEGTPCFRHSTLPDVVPDMIYLDGPSFTKERKIAVDILDMEHKLPPDILLIIDGRVRNTEFLRQHLKRPFQFRDRSWYKNTVVTLGP